MRTPRLGPLAGLAAGLAVAVAAVWVVGLLGPGPRVAPSRPRVPALRHVPEDASAPLAIVLIHYAPASDELAAPVWRQLLAVLPEVVQVKVAVSERRDFDRFLDHLAAWDTPHRSRFTPVVVGAPITTWSRDRFAALQGEGIVGDLLAPPRIGAMHAARAGDWSSPHALARDLFGRKPRTADFVFEGGDLASTPSRLFVDTNLLLRNQGRGNPGREDLVRLLGKHVSQEIVWLGEVPGELPQHHIMMYMVPLDDERVVVGDIRAGRALLAAEPAGADLPVDGDVEGHARRFDRAAELLTARGLRVHRLPAVVLDGAGSYVTYTNAVFDVGPDGRRIVYLPTYRLPALDSTAERFYADLGYRVHPIDVSSIYRHNGSLGCLVNVVARQLD